MASIVTCTLSGDPLPGDELLFYWLDARGGRSATATRVRDGDTPEDIVQRMVDTSEFNGAHFSIAARGRTIVCLASPSRPPGTYAVEVRGTGTGSLDLDANASDRL